MSDSLRPHESQHARPPCPSSTPGVHPNSCPLSSWYHPAILSSAVRFSSCPQSLPASESFPMSQLFAWGGPSIGVSALASVLPKNTQDWSPLEWTGWISLQSKGLSRIFYNTTVQKHQSYRYLKNSLKIYSLLCVWFCTTEISTPPQTQMKENFTNFHSPMLVEAPHGLLNLRDVWTNMIISK